MAPLNTLDNVQLFSGAGTNRSMTLCGSDSGHKLTLGCGGNVVTVFSVGHPDTTYADATGVMVTYNSGGYELTMVIIADKGITNVRVKLPYIPASVIFGTVEEDTKPAKPGMLQLPAHMV